MKITRVKYVAHVGREVKYVVGFLLEILMSRQH